MKEVEIKAVLESEDAKRIAALLIEKGFEDLGELWENDLYFNGIDRDFKKTDEALRIRSAASRTVDRYFITYKGPKLDARSKTRIEHETAIEDAQTGMQLLKALGFKPVLTVSKIRRTLSRGAVTACLDSIDSLGSFLELETVLEDDDSQNDALEGLYKLLEELSISRDKLTRTSYLELLIKNQGDSL